MAAPAVFPASHHGAPGGGYSDITVTEDTCRSDLGATESSGCTFWCAVALGALARGSPIESVSTRSCLANAHVHCLGPPLHFLRLFKHTPSQLAKSGTGPRKTYFYVPPVHLCVSTCSTSNYLPPNRGAGQAPAKRFTRFAFRRTSFLVRLYDDEEQLTEGQIYCDEEKRPFPLEPTQTTRQVSRYCQLARGGLASPSGPVNAERAT